MAATGLIPLWLLAIVQMAIGADVMTPGLKDWLLVPFLLMPIMAMLSMMIYEWLRKVFGRPERAWPIEGRWWLRPAFSFLDSRARGFVWFLNVVGSVLAPFVLFWLVGQILEVVRAVLP